MLLQQALLQRNLSRLGSGLRLNTSTDNPAGLVVSEQLRANIGSVNALATNALRATNLVQTAEGALIEINAQLIAIRGLVVQAGSRAVLGDSDVRSIQGQIESARASINRIADTTQFAGRPLLNGTFEDGQFAVAEDSAVTLAIPSLRTTGLGRGISNQSDFTSLADIDVTTLQGATDAFQVADAAIREVTVVRNELGAVQTETLAPLARNVQLSRENLFASLSTMRDTDFASQIGDTVLARIRLQASILVQYLSPRNTGLIVDLLA
jgi:flagellin